MVSDISYHYTFGTRTPPTTAHSTKPKVSGFFLRSSLPSQADLTSLHHSQYLNASFAQKGINLQKKKATS
jgi:hypothetical protein